MKCCPDGIPVILESGDCDFTIKFYEDNHPDIITSDLHLVHVQDEPSTVWTVEHALDKYPSITIVDDNGYVIFGEIQYINMMKIIITFSEAVTGRVFCN